MSNLKKTNDWYKPGIARIICKTKNKAFFCHSMILIAVIQEILSSLEAGDFTNSEMQGDYNIYGVNDFSIECLSSGEESCGSFFNRLALIEKFKSEWKGDFY